MYMEYKKLEFIIFIKKNLLISETNYNKIYKKNFEKTSKTVLKSFQTYLLESQ